MPRRRSIHVGDQCEMRPDLAACYGQERLPRYTSYPTAPHFSAAIGPDIYTEWLKAIPQKASASLYLHVPFCRAMCWYCGCHSSVARRDEPIAVYAAALRSEIDLVSRQTDHRLEVDHVHDRRRNADDHGTRNFRRPDRGAPGNLAEAKAVPQVDKATQVFAALFEILPTQAAAAK